MITAEQKGEFINHIAYLCKDCPSNQEARVFFSTNIDYICVTMGWLMGKGYAKDFDGAGDFVEEFFSENMEQTWTEIEYLIYKNKGGKAS